MAQPAPRKVGTPVVDATVTITNGKPSQASVTIPSEGTVQFTADNNDYMLQLWDKKNENHPAVCVYLGANQSIYLVGDTDAGSQNSTCYYNVMFYADAASEGVGTGGGNKIIIGSGLDE